MCTGLLLAYYPRFVIHVSYIHKKESWPDLGVVEHCTMPEETKPLCEFPIRAAGLGCTCILSQQGMYIFGLGVFTC